jgi:hypothetical protein
MSAVVAVVAVLVVVVVKVDIFLSFMSIRVHALTNPAGHFEKETVIYINVKFINIFLLLVNT